MHLSFRVHPTDASARTIGTINRRRALISGTLCAAYRSMKLDRPKLANRLILPCGSTAVAVVLATLLSGCSALLFTAANVPTYLTRARAVTGLPYGSNSRQRLDVYALPGATNLPVVVFWYGGSWTSGKKSDYRFVGTALAERGFVAVLPDYRLYPPGEVPCLHRGRSARSCLDRAACARIRGRSDAHYPDGAFRRGALGRHARF